MDLGLDHDGKVDFKDYPCVGSHTAKWLDIRAKRGSQLTFTVGLQVHTGQLSCKSADGWKLTLLLGADRMSSGKTHLEVPGEVGLWQHLLCPTVPVPALYPHLILPPGNTKRKLLFSHFKAEGNILYQRLDVC